MSEYIQEPAEDYGDQLKPALEDARRHQFIMVDYPVIDALPAIGRAAFVVYCVLVRFANKQKICWPTYEQLQEKSGYGFDTVRDALSVLAKWGFISRKQMIKHGRYGANKYTLLDLSAWTKPEPQGENTDNGKTDAEKTDTEKTPDYLDPVLSRSNLNLDPEENTKTRARKNLNFSEKEKDEERQTQWHGAMQELRRMRGYDDEAEERPVGYGEDEEWDRLLSSQPDPHELDDNQGESALPGRDITHIPDFSAIPEACRAYQPNFPCPHMDQALVTMAGVWWTRVPNLPALRTQFNDKEAFHKLCHEYTDAEIRQAAEWWKAHKKPRELSPALFFNQIEMALANAQSVSDGARESIWDVWAREEVETDATRGD